ncbi:DUF4240 domain-containing protein [Bradyrhizobium sp. SRL28]|nr:DUF4240 domain-containing protein [Bradyrhizobium sp. SRL28]
MDQAGFWAIVQAANDASGGDMDRKCDALRQQVSSLSKADAIEFTQLFDAMMGKAYSFPLWGADYVVNGGCSDDTFDDFCSSLISRGVRRSSAPCQIPMRSPTRISATRTGSTKGINTPSPTALRRLPAIGRNGACRINPPGSRGKRTNSTPCFRNSAQSSGDRTRGGQRAFWYSLAALRKERGSNLRWSPSTVRALPGMCPNRSCGCDPGATTTLPLGDRTPGELTCCKRAPCAR